MALLITFVVPTKKKKTKTNQKTTINKPSTLIVSFIYRYDYAKVFLYIGYEIHKHCMKLIIK